MPWKWTFFLDPCTSPACDHCRVIGRRRDRDVQDAEAMRRRGGPHAGGEEGLRQGQETPGGRGAPPAGGAGEAEGARAGRAETAASLRETFHARPTFWPRQSVRGGGRLFGSFNPREAHTPKSFDGKPVVERCDTYSLCDGISIVFTNTATTN